MVSLCAYASLEDAWTGGVADWCRSGSDFVLKGGQAWLVVTNDGQANWIKRRLLCEGTSLFGVRFLDARALRRELCLRRGVEPPTLGRQSLELLLRLHALTQENAHQALAAVARHPAACLAALDEYAAAGWLEDGPELFADFFPSALHEWLPLLRATGSWVPAVDLTLRSAVRETRPGAPLSICTFGWNAAHWPLFDLLVAAARSAQRTEIYAPLPRGTSEAVQQHWLAALETVLEEEFVPCEASDFRSAQSALAARLEGSDLDGPAADRPTAPELLAGRDTADMTALVCDFVARWLATQPGNMSSPAADNGQRLVILCPARDVSSVAVVKALAAAGIAVEDEVGEQPEPSLSVQVQRAILAYHQSGADIDALLALVDLLNELAAVSPPETGSLLARICPLDPVEARRALYGAFADVQHHDARILGGRASLGRAEIARPLRVLLEHLATWPERLPWTEALRRWEECLVGFGLTTEILEPLWTQLAGLPIDNDASSEAFFQFLSGILAGVPPRRSAEGRNRFARVIVTSLEGAMGQTWGGALFLDSNEGAWPIYPGENPFLDDADRLRLNTRRAAMAETDAAEAARGYLLTAADRAQLEHFRFLEILENCTGPLAFAGVARDPAEPSKEVHANEWALRCLIESAATPDSGEKLLDRWRQAVRRTRPVVPTLPVREASHLREIFARRQNPAAAFDGYFFDFSALTNPDELPFAAAWSRRDLEMVWERPATFAVRQIFGAAPWRDAGGNLQRREGWAVGRLVHGWLRVALRASEEPRRMTSDDWQAALAGGLTAARTNTEDALRRSLGEPDELPFWWRSTLGRAEWTARRCLEILSETARRPGPDGVVADARWLCLERVFQVDLKTPQGPLKLKARCDALLLDRPQLAGASGLLIDVRTGATPTVGAPTAAQLADGHGLGVGTLLMLGVAAGLDPVATAAGIIHPDASNPAQWTAENASLLESALEQLAVMQRSLVFGQKGALTGGHRQEDTEDLPLATVPVSPAVLAAKATVDKSV